MKNKLAILIFAAMSAKASDWYVESWERPRAVLRHDGNTYWIACDYSYYGRKASTAKEWKREQSNSCMLASQWVGKRIEDGPTKAAYVIEDHGGTVLMWAEFKDKNTDNYIQEIYTVISVEIGK
jgi:hypothetical protein